jgi:hypothetical protein
MSVVTVAWLAVRVAVLSRTGERTDQESRSVRRGAASRMTAEETHRVEVTHDIGR